MSAGPVEQLRIEADVDLGVTSRVLDMLSALDRFPSRMRLDRDARTETLSMVIEITSGAVNLPGRIGQIPGVRRVEPLFQALP